MTGRLQGKVAAITGGVSGIGRATAELFVAEGAKVVVADIADDLGRGLESSYAGALTYRHTDVTVEAEIEALAATAVEKYGRLDIMFSNAGTGGDPAPFQDITQDGFTAAKHAVVGVVREATAQLMPLGIRSNAVAPGITMTGIMGAAFGVPREKDEEFEAFLAERLAGNQPAGRVGQPEDIANAVLYFASDESSWVSGVVLSVDGGQTAVSLGGWLAAAAQAGADFTGQ